MKLSLYHNSRASTPMKVQPHDEHGNVPPISPVGTPARRGRIVPESPVMVESGLNPAVKEFCQELVRKQERKLERQIQTIDSNLFNECHDITIRLSQLENSMRDISKQFTTVLTSRALETLVAADTVGTASADVDVSDTRRPLAARISALEAKVGSPSSPVIYLPGNHNELKISYECDLFARSGHLQSLLIELTENVRGNSSRIQSVESAVADLLTELDGGLKKILAGTSQSRGQTADDFLSLDVVFNRVAGSPHGIGTANEFNVPSSSRSVKAKLERPGTTSVLLEKGNSAAARKDFRSQTAGPRRTKTAKKWKRIAQDAKRTISFLRQKVQSIEQVGNHRIALVDKQLKQHDAKLLEMESGITTVRLRNRQLASRGAADPHSAFYVGDSFEDTLYATKDVNNGVIVPLPEVVSDEEAEAKLAKFEAIVSNFNIFRQMSSKIADIEDVLARITVHPSRHIGDMDTHDHPKFDSELKSSEQFPAQRLPSSPPPLSAEIVPTSVISVSPDVPSNQLAILSAWDGSADEVFQQYNNGNTKLKVDPDALTSGTHVLEDNIVTTQQQTLGESQIMGTESCLMSHTVHIHDAKTKSLEPHVVALVDLSTHVASFENSSTPPLEELQRQLQDQQTHAATVNSDRVKTKKEIKSWIEAFIKTHGAEPTVVQKEPIRGLYELYATVRARRSPVSLLCLNIT
jgi:uncharacterized protein YoxC